MTLIKLVNQHLIYRLPSSKVKKHQKSSKAAPVTPKNEQGKKGRKGIKVEKNMIPNIDEEKYDGYSTQQVKTPKGIRRHSRQVKVILVTPCIIIFVNEL